MNQSGTAGAEKLKWEALAPDLLELTGGVALVVDKRELRGPPPTEEKLAAVEEFILRPFVVDALWATHGSSLVELGREFSRNVLDLQYQRMMSNPLVIEIYARLYTNRLADLPIAVLAAPPTKGWFMANAPKAYGGLQGVPFRVLATSWGMRGFYYRLHEMLIHVALKASLEACRQLNENSIPPDDGSTLPTLEEFLR